MSKPLVMAVLATLLSAPAAMAQTTPPLTQRGFIQAGALAFPETAANDRERLVGDVLARAEVFVKPAAWIQFAGGIDIQAQSHDQVGDSWTPDFSDRAIRRPPVSIRRAAATLSHRTVTVDVGKQFIRWGKTDIVNPVDRFAPRDFLNVITSELLAVTGVRASWQHDTDTVEGVWIPRLTPSRIPLLDQRWTAVPADGVPFSLRDAGAQIPGGSQVGVRWSHVGSALEYALSYFDGFNHLPNIESQVDPRSRTVGVRRGYPAIRSYGLETAIPTPLFTIKGEAEMFTSTESPAATDNYLLYVVQIERQSGEWVFVGGYAGEAVTTRRSALAFAPDRGMAKSMVGRASYTIDPRRSLAFEGALRRLGDGVYGKAEYSEARGNHWRLTLTAVAIAGHSDDFLGQYRRNGHVGATVRYSF